VWSVLIRELWENVQQCRHLIWRVVTTPMLTPHIDRPVLEKSIQILLSPVVSSQQIGVVPPTHSKPVSDFQGNLCQFPNPYQGTRCTQCGYPIPWDCPDIPKMICGSGQHKLQPAGNRLSNLLKTIGITPVSYRNFKMKIGLAPTCGCKERKGLLNKLHYQLINLILRIERKIIQWLS